MPLALGRAGSSRSLVPNRVGLIGVLCALGLLVLAAPAVAVVAKFGATKVGLQPREVAYYTEGPYKHDGEGGGKLEPLVYSFNNPSGAPVLHNVSTYAIYWDPQYYYHDDWASVIDGFLSNLAYAGADLSSGFAVDAQYMDATNHPAAGRSAFLGAYTDTTAYPAAEVGCKDPKPFIGGPLREVGPGEYEAICLTDAQIQHELGIFVAGHHLRTGMETIFYLLTPPGVAVCLEAEHCSEYSGNLEEIEADEKARKQAEAKEEAWVEPAGYTRYKNSFCSYHSAIGSGDAETILYATIPWTAGGEGDPHLSLADSERPAFDCQDGGFGPATKPTGELQEKEKEKEKTPLEEEEFAAKSPAEKRKQLEAEGEHLAKPHEQEPNQPVGGKRSPDGGFDTGLADLIVNQIAIEQQNTVTDPLLNAWQDSAGKELTDECRNSFFPTSSGSVTASPESRAGTLGNEEFTKHYYLNDTFDLASLQLAYPGVPCLHGVMLEPQFTVPNPVNAGEIVGFNGMESEITLNVANKFGGPKGEEYTYSTYKWNFGDGSPEVTGYAPGAPPGNPPTTLCEQPWLAPCAGSTFHSYQYGGTYQVTLTVSDVAGNTASFVAPVTVEGPPPPASSPGDVPGGSSGSGSPAGTPGTTGSSSGKTTSPAPGPVAAVAAVSTSLKQVAKHGLVVKYSVNEQVAGRFEVLLPASVAHALKIGGHVATGLPAGFPQSLVIGQALLVTTKGGHGSVRIKFSKHTAKRLRHAHKVTLTLRLKVRSASQNPLFTTVMSTVVLHH